MNKNGQVCYDSRLIALNYMRGWFLLDLLAAIPFDLLYAFDVDTVSYFCLRDWHVPDIRGLVDMNPTSPVKSVVDKVDVLHA